MNWIKGVPRTDGEYWIACADGSVHLLGVDTGYECRDGWIQQPPRFFFVGNDCEENEGYFDRRHGGITHHAPIENPPHPAATAG